MWWRSLFLYSLKKRCDKPITLTKLLSFLVHVLFSPLSLSMIQVSLVPVDVGFKLNPLSLGRSHRGPQGGVRLRSKARGADKARLWTDRVATRGSGTLPGEALLESPRQVMARVRLATALLPLATVKLRQTTARILQATAKLLLVMASLPQLTRPREEA